MGEGKTQLVKKFIAGRRSFIFDTNNEYGLSTDWKKEVSRMEVLDHNLFIDRCLMKRNTCCVFEDATGFLRGRLSDKFVRALVSKRHTGNNNMLLFHSIIDTPPGLVRLSDFIILFKTNDEMKYVEKKYPSLYKLALAVNSNSVPVHSYILHNRNNGSSVFVHPQINSNDLDKKTG